MGGEPVVGIYAVPVQSTLGYWSKKSVQQYAHLKLAKSSAQLKCAVYVSAPFNYNTFKDADHVLGHSQGNQPASTANVILPEEGAELVAPALLVSGCMLVVMSEEGGAVGRAAGEKREGLFSPEWHHSEGTN